MTRFPQVPPNLLFNGDFSRIPSFTAPTTTGDRWINGQAAGSAALHAYGWAIPSGALVSSASAEFETDEDLGLNRLKLSTLDATGVITVASTRNTSANSHMRLIRLAPSTSYTIEFYLETHNVAANSAFLDFVQLNAALGTVATTSSAKRTGTTARSKVVITVTTGASTVFGRILARNNVAGNIGWAKFDSIPVRKTTAPARAAVA
jgi:hypothetical protein